MDQHFRYHQFCANMLLAIVFTYCARLAALTDGAYQGGWIDLGVFVVVAVLLAGSRDALQKYYRRTEALFPSRSPIRKEHAMNGGQKGHQSAPKSADAKAATAEKSTGKPKAESVAKPRAK